MSSKLEAIQTRSENVKKRPAVNFSILYCLGAFGLETTFKVFAGFYMSYYISELGLAVAIVAIINAISDAVNDPLVGYLSD